MIIAALVTFGALLACWLFAASDPELERHDPVAGAAAGAAADPVVPDLVRAA